MIVHEHKNQDVRLNSEAVRQASPGFRALALYYSLANMGILISRLIGCNRFMEFIIFYWVSERLRA
jgi:hypothetical protein